jgi:hypothetical protein
MRTTRKVSNRSMGIEMLAKRALIAVFMLVDLAKPGFGAEPEGASEHSLRQPTGFFVMQQVDRQNVSDAKLASPKLTGIVIRQRWSAVEPTANSYDWKFIDEQVARAKRFGKKYILAIYTGDNDPTWLNVPLYLGAPYPWDTTMLAAHGKMVEQLGKRFALDHDLVGVEIGGPTRAPSGSLEMHLATGLTYQRGYSEAAMIAAWKHCIDQYAAAFPQCALISDGGVAPGGRKATITQAVLDYLLAKCGDRANFSHCALKANTPEDALHHAITVNMGKRGGRIGFEMIGPSVGGANGENGAVRRFGGDFRQALQIAERAHAKWLKIYQGDERNLPEKMPEK